MRHPLLLPLVALLAACAPSAPSTAPTPATAPAKAPAAAPLPAATPAPTTPPAPTYDTPPRDWQLLDAVKDGVQGVSARRAEQELLAGRKPARTIVVAVIDGGVDTAHADLRPQLWQNAKETPNGKDDDGDGLVDDTHGWNYLGGPDGRSVKEETLELTREYARCSKAATKPPECSAIVGAYEAKRAESQQEAAQLEQMATVYSRVIAALKGTLKTDSLTPEAVRGIQPANDTIRAAQDLYLRFAEAGVTGAALEEAVAASQSTLKYGLNPDLNARAIVGDDPTNGAQRTYGNRDVTGPDADHGTHVAGIIGAVRGDSGADGVATAVKIMSVRAVPDGDERDKDVANAIRYAVDHGAQIINMSFGKGYSPEKAWVDDAVKYADSKGVLLIHAAGNEGANLAVESNFPNARYLAGGSAKNWIEVGASSWKGGQQLAASFSNYGKREVDLFAPGVDILSTVPGGGYERNSGTSMAAPVVSGVAAMLMSYFPKLTAADVKRILMQTVTRYPDQQVVRPGSAGETVPFGELSVTGGVVNAYEAVRAALASEGALP